MKRHRYSPILATRELAADAQRQMRAGTPAASIQIPQPFEHATIEHKGYWCSYWWFWTPRGRKELYFHTGVPASVAGEVERQEYVRAQYVARMAQPAKE